jgi:hypothetical protein
MLRNLLLSILRAYIRADLAASVPFSAIRSILQGMRRSELQNILGGVPGDVLAVYL